MNYNWYQLYLKSENRPVLFYTIEDLDFVVYVGKMFHVKQKIYFPTTLPSYDDENGIVFLIVDSVIFVGISNDNN